MSKEEHSHFSAKEVTWVTASKKGKKQVKPDSTLQMELPHSPWKQVAVISGLAKEVGLSIQNDYEKQHHGNPCLTDKLKEAIK